MCKHFGAEGQSSIDITKGREVLPANVKPLHYDLTLEPDFANFTYQGTVTIDLDVIDDTTSITLNTNELKIHSTKVVTGQQLITDSPTLASDDDAQTTKVSFDQTIPSGSKAQLTMTFSGILNDNMAGFYRSSFKAEDGSTTYMATTQMEPTDARRAFPCFDEPALKAKFTVTLIADDKMTCLSNMDWRLKSKSKVPYRVESARQSHLTQRHSCQPTSCASSSENSTTSRPTAFVSLYECMHPRIGKLSMAASPSSWRQGRWHSTRRHSTVPFLYPRWT